MNKLVIAAAGSGKTEFLVNSALENKNNVLITTFTDNNAAEIKHRIYSKNGCIPSRITIMPWFSFMLTHGIKPYQDVFYSEDIKGIVFPGGQSGKFTKEKDISHYITSDGKIYSDKIAKLFLKLNKMVNGRMIENINKLYPQIMIDEIQDISGYDLEIVESLFNSKSEMLCVGDPRQGVFSTDKGAKNKKYSKSHITDFFKTKVKELELDNSSLNTNYRCTSDICTLSNSIYPDFQAVLPGNNYNNDYLGCFVVKPADVDKYLQKFNPIQLRLSKMTKVNEKYNALNFGMSKGLSFDRVLIYPTKKMLDWILLSKGLNSEETMAKLYVAITRARYSVAFVCDYEESFNHSIIKKYK